MVGVPGKSKGCNTCRRRKKGCDLQRPTCGQCQNAGLLCEGYTRERIFVHKGKRSTISSTSASDSYDTSLSRLTQGAASQAMSLIPLPTSCQRTATNAQLGSLFWSHYLPESLHIQSPLVGISGMWTETPKVLSMSEPALELSFLSVSAARIGHDFNDPRLLQEGWKAYCAGMRELHRALMDPKRLPTNEVLSASGMLAMYEVYEGVSPGFTAWMTHIQGASHILSIRGPEMCGSDTAYRLLLGQRIQESVVSLRKGTLSVLASEEWRNVPWENRPKDLRDQLLDIMLHLSTATGSLNPMEENYRVQASVDGAALPHLMQQLDRCWAIDADLLEWYEKVEHHVNGQQLFYVRSTTHIERHEIPLTHMITFPDIMTGQVLALYWTCCHLLYSRVHQIYSLLLKASSLSPLDSADFGGGQPPELPARMDPLPYIILIAQSIPYFLDEAAKAAGRSLIAFPAMAALQAIARPEVGNLEDKPALLKYFMKQTRKIDMKGLPAPFPGFVRKMTEAGRRGIDVVELVPSE